MTANNRLAREIGRHYAVWQGERGLEVWERPSILPWSAWQQGLFYELVELGVVDLSLLSAYQARLLWEDVIRHEAGGGGILRPGAAARTAAAAWRLIHAWCISHGELEAEATAESEGFLTWANAYLKRCRHRRWFDEARLPDLLSEHFEGGGLSPPERLILAGFDEFTPQQRRLIETLAGVGCEVRLLAVGEGEREGSARRVSLNDTEQELEVAVRWAAARLRETPHARIGLIVPGLTERRDALERVLERTFYPRGLLPGHAPRSRLYNLSLGRSLSSCPVVGDALLALELAQGELGFSGIGRLLRSSFFLGGEKEWTRRARLDARLRDEVGERIISLDTLFRKLLQTNRREVDACPELMVALRGFRREISRLPKRAPPGVWAARILSLLHTLGWPEFSGLGSEEYQQVQAFRDQLALLSPLDLIQPSMTLAGALHHLRSLLDEEVFQPESPDAPVQVVGVLEAVGLSFDHAWVLGLTDEQWPPPALPNPLLPVRVQRRHNIAHASAARELEFATLLTGRLFSESSGIIVSHAAREGERELRPSPLIMGLPSLPLEQLDLLEGRDPCQLGFGSATLEMMVDEVAPPVERGSPLSGGTALLADQASCPFRAFANHRLGARPLEEPVLGLDRRVSGTLVHSVLEQVWEALMDQSALLAASAVELERLVSSAVDQALGVAAPFHPVTFAPRFTGLERERMIALILEWLELEKGRAPFCVVSLEEQKTVSVGGLELKTKADRIDRLEDGRLLVIDYKTGNPDFKEWFEERMGEPQLPLYTTVGGGEVAGVFLARVRRGKAAFLGVAEGEGIVPDGKAFADTKPGDGYAGWDALLLSWKQNLEQLGREVLEGRADVNPKDEVKITCRYCALMPLCRIHEREGDTS